MHVENFTHLHILEITLLYWSSVGFNDDTLLLKHCKVTLILVPVEKRNNLIKYVYDFKYSLATFRPF